MNSRVPELIELPSEIVGFKDEGEGSRVRGLPDQVHQGLEAFSEQRFQKRASNGSDQFSSPPIFRRSLRLLQKAEDSVIVIRNDQVGLVMEVPSSMCSQGEVPVLRLRGGGPRKVIRRPTIQRSRRSTHSERTVPSPLFGTPIHPILM